MHPRLKVIVLGVISYLTIYTYGTIKNIDWSDAGQTERSLIIFLLWGVVPAFSVAIHFFSQFEKNFYRWSNEINFVETGARFDQITTGEGGLTGLKHPSNILFSYAQNAAEQKRSRGEFVVWILLMSFTSLLMSWSLPLTSFAFSKK